MGVSVRQMLCSDRTPGKVVGCREHFVQPSENRLRASVGWGTTCDCVCAGAGQILVSQAVATKGDDDTMQHDALSLRR